jgi:23S rRNA-/tRNA-specific pseudouridylate synthase
MILGTKKLTVRLSRRYRISRLNSMTAINRLDRLTSGLMIIPLSAECASIISKELIKGTVRKEYIARCRGKFPELVPPVTSIRIFDVDICSQGGGCVRRTIINRRPSDGSEHRASRRKGMFSPLDDFRDLKLPNLVQYSPQKRYSIDYIMM